MRSGMNSTRTPINFTRSGVHCIRSGIDSPRTLAICTPRRTHSTWTAIHPTWKATDSTWTGTRSTWMATHCLRNAIVSTRVQMKADLRVDREVLKGVGLQTRSCPASPIARFAKQDRESEGAGEVTGGYRRTQSEACTPGPGPTDSTARLASTRLTRRWPEPFAASSFHGFIRSRWTNGKLEPNQ